MTALALATAGCVSPASPPSLEEQAQDLDKSLICPVCPGETIDQSQAALAKQMRAIVREKLAAGESREQVLEFFVKRYGDGVLAAPPKGGFHLLAWTVPPVLVLGAAAGLYALLRRMGRQRPRRGEATGGGDLEQKELAPYLARVDEELRLLLGPSGPGSPLPPGGKATGG